jgi:hypothetical protein
MNLPYQNIDEAIATSCSRFSRQDSFETDSKVTTSYQDFAFAIEYLKSFLIENSFKTADRAVFIVDPCTQLALSTIAISGVGGASLALPADISPNELQAHLDRINPKLALIAADQYSKFEEVFSNSSVSIILTTSPLDEKSHLGRFIQRILPSSNFIRKQLRVFTSRRHVPPLNTKTRVVPLYTALSSIKAGTSNIQTLNPTTISQHEVALLVQNNCKTPQRVGASSYIGFSHGNLLSLLNQLNVANHDLRLTAGESVLIFCLAHEMHCFTIANLFALLNGLKIRLHVADPKLDASISEQYERSSRSTCPSIVWMSSSIIAKMGAEAESKVKPHHIAKCVILYCDLIHIKQSWLAKQDFATKTLQIFVPDSIKTPTHITMLTSNARTGRLGLPLLNQETKLVEDSGVPVMSGEVGRLFVRGQHLPVTIEHQDGWINTNILCTQDEMGRYTFIGDASDIINVNGMQLLRSEIEAVILSRHEVSAVKLAVSRDAESTRDMLTAFVVCQANNPIDLEELKIHCQRCLPAHNVPRHYISVDHLD